ncbi:Tyrosyl-DNA phosphodiesterase [Quillaja saponaria]|uniref:Tyrosyl-DNA phosphodiesterase n=1 Tax=Quillaja saponaria TaxID=32244 RepID=A0AAD7P803_QUISA|nr:Tyrosyl-DNA phosphodiesterase [Quillaja saponaria]
MKDLNLFSSSNPRNNDSSNINKRDLEHDCSPNPSSDLPCKKLRSVLGKKAVAIVDFENFDVPLMSTGGNDSHSKSIHLQPDRPYTIGRSTRYCQFVFHDRRVSKQHCQILFDGSLHKIYILDGTLSFNDSSSFFVHGSRNRLSTNGVFVDGVRIKKGMAVELSVGDKILLVCGSDDGHCNRNQIGFVIRRIEYVDGVLQECEDVALCRTEVLGTTTSSGHSQGLTSCGKRNKRIFALRANDSYPDSAFLTSKYEQLVGRAKFLLSWCRGILHCDDPLSLLIHANPDIQYVGTSACSNHLKGLGYRDNFKVLVDGELQSRYVKEKAEQETILCENSNVGWIMENTQADVLQPNSITIYGRKSLALEAESEHGSGDHLSRQENIGIVSDNAIADNDTNISSSKSVGNKHGKIASPPGKNFYLNRLDFIDCLSSAHHTVISLPELLYPVENISQMFIATFTSDINWFLSYCEIPFHLPVTIACHNTERCWSSNTDSRISWPEPDYPNLVVVYPPFPESIAFSNNRKKQGIACHHPKLFVVQREDNIRVVVTSANLVEKQWNKVTNTIWWQDFPRSTSPDYSSLFTQVNDEEVRQDTKSDFAAHLAGFMASLLIDVPSQAHWIIELTKYDFTAANGHLIASVPEIHTYRTSCMSESTQSLPLLGSVVASVVGLSHLFHSAADSNGARLKMLAAFLRKSSKKNYGWVEIVLRRNLNVPADANAVSVLVPNPSGFSKGEYVQLGFLAREVAKWVSPLWDVGFFGFSGYICPEEALTAALGENCKKVRLRLHVSQGCHFRDIARMMQPEHVVSFCSLIASVQRCSGLWRLQEVLSRYKWPESLESDFIYGASSIGSSVNPQFLAAFSAAAGKKSLQYFDSEESDPEWGYWNAGEELKNPSIRIIFPTIERVKNGCHGILPARRMLCFSERTWQRLRTVDILHDAIPHPNNRVGHPMHVKVARRRFQSRRDASSFGWVYCGSHNFSAAAWGRAIANPSKKSNGSVKENTSDLGLHICNYELGIIFICPPTDTNGSPMINSTNLDDITLPFVMPAPRYGPMDRPATMQAMREALTELTKQESDKLVESATDEEIMEEIPDEEEEEMPATSYVTKEKEEEKAYAEILWSQVDSSQSC